MRTTHIPCGPFVNVSEEMAYRSVDAWLRRHDNSKPVYILTNLSHACARGQPDEIDQVVLGPGSAVVIEVKHWDRSKLRSDWEVDPHIELIAGKAKRVAGRLRTVFPSLSYVPPAMLLTKDAQSLRRNERLPERSGIRFYGVKDLDELLSPVSHGPPELLARMARVLASRQVAAGSLARRRLV
jgi:hypothetical protein